MPHVSKRALSKKDFQNIYKSFTQAFNKFQGNDIERLFGEFLTHTERVMLSKRLAIILLLDKGISPYRIWKGLKVSSSTVGRLGKRLEKGDYISILKILHSKKKNSKLIKFLDVMVDLLTPPPYYLSREKFIEYKRKHG
ncbi:MAG: hypothetical protein HYS51_00105 [Candidatus Zambryskibacteria bacterium]|nr:hypothetical protein [Candidatus Zambryskibacteria bacterium]